MPASAEQVKTAFLDGVQRALRNAGLLPEEKPSLLRRAAPWGAAGAAGLGAAALLRRPSLARNPALRQLQRKALDQGFHRLVDVSYRGKRPGFWKGVGQTLRDKLTGVDKDRELADRLGEWWAPQVTKKGVLPWQEKLKLWLQEGGAGVPVASNKHTGKSWIVGHDPTEKLKMKGIVAGAPEDTTHGFIGESSPRTLIEGGQDIEGSKKTLEALTDLGEAGKRREARLFEQYAPGAMPETVTDLRPFIKDLELETPEQRIKAVKLLQQRLQEHFGGKKFLLKPNIGLQSGGEFPYGSDKWHKLTKKFEKKFKEGTPRRTKLREAAEQGLAGVQDLGSLLAKHELEDAYVLQQALYDPKSVIAQRLVRKPIGEYRVNLVQGHAPRSMITQRHSGGLLNTLGLHLGGIGHQGVTAKGLGDFAEEIAARMPKQYQQGSYGFDVMAYPKKHKGGIGYKLIESNPYEMSHAGNEAQGIVENPGGGSGFWRTDVMPHAGWAMQRMATGRQALPAAIAGGLGAAGLVGAGAYGAERATR